MTADKTSDLIRPKSQPKTHYCSLDNEAARAFQSVIGGLALALYVTLATDALGKSRLQSNQRRLASETGQSLATVSRNLRILIHVGMVRANPGGGNNDTTYELIDLKGLAQSYGAVVKRGVYLALPADAIERLKREVAALRHTLTGKKPKSLSDAASTRGGDESFAFHQRDASVSPEERQRFTSETQKGSLQFRKKEEVEKSPSPTSSRCGELGRQQNRSTNDKDREALLKAGRDRFNGVMDGLRNHLLNPGAAKHPNLNDGLAEWKLFDFGSLAVEAISKRDESVELTISATDPDAARRGVQKYQRIWDAQNLKWFGYAVQVEFVSKGFRRGEGDRGSKSLGPSDP